MNANPCAQINVPGGGRRSCRLRVATSVILAWLSVVIAPVHAETLTQSATLSRAQLETTGASITLNAADTSPTTAQALSIELRFPEVPLTQAGGNAWTYTVRYSVTSGATTSAIRSLTLFRGVDRDVFRAVDRIDPLGAATARIDINGTATTDALAVPATIELQARLESVRYSAFTRNVAPTLSRTTSAESLLRWTAVTGAEEYEIESVFRDARDSTSSNDPFKARMPVRFQTRQLSTPIDIYHSAGTIYYRVRAVGRHVSNPQARRPGVWSATLAVPIVHNGFEPGKNWQYARRYDGDGPIQGVLNYFDGALRLRQAQSGAPDQSARRIAETKFDFEGRPAVNFLAAPQPGKPFDFVPGFNRAADGTPYGPQHFDRNGITAASTTSGAGRYFSGNNTAIDNASAYLPDAEGFPFSVAEHTRDDSARLRAMSGFGSAQRLGSGHDTQYVYGDASEPDLRPLFGNNLGDPRHYERTVVGDPNRAFEAVYRDGSDRVIAQSLVGDPPPNLSDLPGAPSAQLRTVSMSASNQVDAQAGRSRLTYRIANAVNTNYHFTYSPTGVEYGADPGDPRFPPLCESCRYRLHIRILGPNGAPVPLAQASTMQNDPDCTGLSASSVVSAIDQVIENPTPRSCSVPGAFTSSYSVPPVKFCAKLTESGEYEVQKTLELLDGDVDASIQEYERKPGFFDITSYRDPVDPASCGESCNAHCATATGIDPATHPNDPQLLQCVERCEHPDKWVMDRIDKNKCNALEDTLRQDMAPGGRHFRPGTANALSDHPEYCHLGVCRALETSDRYDLDMGMVETWDAAVCGGYLNPTGMPTAPATGPPTVPATCSATPARDPFFANGGPGAALRGTIDGQLANFTTTVSGWTGAALSIWQFVADPRINSTGVNATPTPDEQWRLFRSLYLGAKKRLINQQTESGTGFNCPFSNAAGARVPKPPLPSTVIEVIDAIAGATEAQCSALCAVKVTQWLGRLQGSCPNPANPTQLEHGLLEYCQSSCGANNPLGLLIAEDLQRGAPGLADAVAGLGANCSLDDIAVKDPYVRQTVCGETCCCDTKPVMCETKVTKEPPKSKPPVSPSPELACPTCLDELETVLKDWPAIGTLANPEMEPHCFLSAVREGNQLIMHQAGGRTCLLYLLDKSGRIVPPGRIVKIDQLMRGAVLPTGLRPLAPTNARYLGVAVRVQTATGVDVLYIFSDCEVLSTEFCGSVCTPITKPPVCLSRVLAELVHSQSTSGKVRGSKEAHKDVLTDCFSKLRASKNGASFQISDGGKCRLVLIGHDGRLRPLTALRDGDLRWVGTTPTRPQVGPYKFMGYVIVTKKGEIGVYSDCDFPQPESCETIVVGIDTPIPPPVGDPHDDCVAATNEAADQSARVKVERARDEFEHYFKSVHYNRCFGTTLQESFSYQARSREYHFTLRYYDQAGNLVQTVPPEGIVPTVTGTQSNPAHRMLSKFRYNSLNQIIAQSTPDTGERIFVYDHADRVRFSQNAQQRLDGTFSYTKYDARNRIIESGLLRGVSEAVVNDRVNEVDFPAAADGVREQIVQTMYDTAAAVPACAPITPRNLRNRVAAIVAATSLGTATLCYSYDVQGRPQTVLRDLPGLGAKTIEYDYDVLTGKVAAIHYQRGQPDALHHRQQFNRLGQIERVETSQDGILWETDARFSYFAHGPLARLELGADRVQGLDYTYTLDGRPKGLNTGTLTPERDPGHDGLADSPNAEVARDIAGQSLEFYDDDYKPIGLAANTLTPSASPHSTALLRSVNTVTPSAFALASCSPVSIADGCGLYEGNVARSVLGLEGLDGFARVTGFAYRYDRLYRLTDSSSHEGLNPGTHAWPAGPDQSLWSTSLAYDGNGNISSLSRFALTDTTPAPTGAWMDRLSYRYATDTQGRLVANRLQHVNDSVLANAFAQDLDDQGAYTPLNAGTHNYAYDANGNLTRDRSAGLTAIRWNIENHVSEVEKGTEKYEYLYDGLGERFARIHKPSSDPATWETEYFVRDGQKNLIATYRETASAMSAPPILEELYLRGGVALGVVRADSAPPPTVQAGTFAQVRGDKQYQLANYLGHVLATVSDRRLPVLSPSGDIEGYAPQILSATDYDPFGAVQPGRFSETEAYRFGFNGFERDDELKGAANSYYTQERLFDPRLGRWLSPDPIQLANSSPYAAFSNNPLRFGDPRGQLDWDSFKDTMENVAITTRDIGKDAAYVFSGAAAVDAVADNLVKAKDAYNKGQISEALGHAIGVQDSIDSLIEKNLAWEEAGATNEDLIRMTIGEVSGMNDVARAVTGATEFDVELSTAERVQVGAQGLVQVVTVAATGARLASSALTPKPPPGAKAPKPAVKDPHGPPCPTGLSFAPDTPVWTVQGLAEIGSLAAGSEVITLHPESGQFDLNHVSAVTTSLHTDGLRLVLEGPDGRAETILTTAEHPFWRLGSGWTRAAELKVGDDLKGRDGTLRIRVLTAITGEFEAYNLSVDAAQTYFVGEQGAWVHNCGDGKSYYTKTARLDARKAAGGECEYCGKKTQTKSPYKSNSAEGDHFIPQDKGGKTTPDNLVNACRECNGSGGKGAKMPGTEWKPKNPNARVKKMMKKLEK